MIFARGIDVTTDNFWNQKTAVQRFTELCKNEGFSSIQVLTGITDGPGTVLEIMNH